MSAKRRGKPGTRRRAANATASAAGSAAAAAAAWLRQLLLQLASVGMADARRMAEFPSSSLHALRVRMKKLKALLRLAEAVISGRKMDSLSAGIREVKDPLAPARDAEVLLKTAREFDVRIAVHEPSDSGAVPDLQPALHSLQRRLTRLDLTGLQWSDIAAAHNKTRRRMRKCMKRSKQSGEAPDFHRWRRRVKDLYYQCLVLPGEPEAANRLRRLRKLARVLGKVQDLAMLEEHLCTTAADAALRIRVACHRTDLQGKSLRKGRKAAKQP